MSQHLSSVPSCQSIACCNVGSLLTKQISPRRGAGCCLSGGDSPAGQALRQSMQHPANEH